MTQYDHDWEINGLLVKMFREINGLLVKVFNKINTYLT